MNREMAAKRLVFLAKKLVGAPVRSVPSWYIPAHELEKFIRYFFDFYGENGLTPIIGLTETDVRRGIKKLQEQMKKDPEMTWGGGDSVDRERVRDLVLKWRKTAKRQAGEVPEAFKEQWKKNKKDDGDKDDKKPDFLKDKKAAAGTLLKLARELVAAEYSPFKTKMDLDDVRRDLEHRSIRVLNAALNLGAKAKLVEESLLTYSEGSSHKFHFFALYNDNGVWKAGNAYGRIGGEPKAMQIASGSESSARSAYESKLRAKKAKGYEEA